jgi:hypothetical protein
MTKHIDKIALQAYDNIALPNDQKQLLFQHAVLCQVYLPYKNLGDEVRMWEKRQGKAFFNIESKYILNPETGKYDILLGLPYGPKARLVLTHINTLALQQQTPNIEIGNSLTSFVKSCGLTASGEQILSIKNQIARLASSSMSIAFSPEDKRIIQVNSQIIKGFDVWFPKNESQRVIWDSNIILSDDYFHSLMCHAIPLDALHVAALSNNALALDIYTWLAQRLHRVKDVEFVHWAGLKEQFGDGYNRMSSFKIIFRKTLKLVLTQYSQAKIQEKGIKGFNLYPSLPPVPRKSFQIPNLNPGIQSNTN